MLFVLLLIVIFSALQLLGASGVALLFAAPLVSGVCALIVFAIILVSYFKTPPEKLTQSACTNYVLFVAVLCVVTIQTDASILLYSALFYTSLFFAGAFGAIGVGTGIAALGAIALQQSLGNHVVFYQLVAPLSVGVILLAASIFMWSRKASTTEKETNGDRSYHELARQLSQESGKADGVINAIQDGVLSLNKTGVVELINPAAQTLLGWSSGDSLTLSYKSIFKMRNTKNQEVDEANDPIEKVLTTNQRTTNDSFSLVTKSGKTFMASISVSPIGDLGSGVIVVFRDITAERSSERQRAEFISTASHEMRTPVASIEGYLGLALNPSISTIDDKARDYINKAHASAQHLGRLFADLLDVSKADDSRLKNTPKTVNVVPFVHDIVQGFETNAKDKGLYLIYKPAPDDDDEPHDPIRKLNPIFYAHVDNDHLREIVQNLVENALKYTLNGGVSVDVTGNDEHITISISDTGIGIPREDQAHLFQKFYRIDNSDTREIGGTGLGLYLCRRLAEAIGGRLWVESEYKQGSTFYLEIPRIDAEEAQRRITQEETEATQEKEAENDEAAQEAKKAKEATMLAQARERAQQMKVQDQAVPTPTPAPLQAPQITTPTPVPQAAETPYVPNPQPAPATIPSNRPNTPLSAIESNPSRYLAPRRADGSVIAPERKP